MSTGTVYVLAEVVYAAESLKDIIPLTLEPRYKPHGWLKFHVSDRLQYDFSRDEKFDESFPKLVSALNKIFEPLIAKLGKFKVHRDECRFFS